MKIAKNILENEKALLVLLAVQLTIYWVCILGADVKTQFVAYQQF